MSVYDNNKFFWLKLKKDFFKRHDIKIIEGSPNGTECVLLYLKLLCESLDHDGYLRFSDNVPYTNSMLASVFGIKVEIVNMAMQLFIDLQMIEILEDKSIFMKEVDKMLGSSTNGAEKKRIQRANRQANLSDKNDENGQQVDNEQANVHQSIEVRTPSSSNIIYNNTLYSSNPSSFNENKECISVIPEENDQQTIEKSEQKSKPSKKDKEQSKTKLSSVVNDCFDKTWAIYPHKVGKEQAKKTWTKKLGLLKTEDEIKIKARKIYSLLTNHIDGWKKEVRKDGVGRPKQYIPHFSTWLNDNIPDKES